MTDTFSPLTLNDKIANSNLWCYQGEELKPGEMRVTLMGTGWGSVIRPNQKGASIYIELGGTEEIYSTDQFTIKKPVTFLFDAGPGSCVNYNVMQIPMSRMDKIFLTHLHADHCSDLDWIYMFGPSCDRFTPFNVWGPHNYDPPKEGENNAIPDMDEFIEGLAKSTHWHRVSFESCIQPCHGYKVNYTRLDYRQTPRSTENIPPMGPGPVEEESMVIGHDAPGPGIAYYNDTYDGHEQYGPIKITHCPALHIIDGAISYCLEWNGYKLVWSGDTQPNYYVADLGKGADLFIHETAPSVARMQQSSGLSQEQCETVIGYSHTPALALGKILSMAKPKLAVTSHCPIDPQELQDFIQGVGKSWDFKISKDNKKYSNSDSDRKANYQIGEDLMVFTLSKDSDQYNKLTIRKGGIHERPWNPNVVKNPITLQKDEPKSMHPLDPWEYRSADIFNDSDAPSEFDEEVHEGILPVGTHISAQLDPNDPSTPGHHIPNSAWDQNDDS